MGLRINKNIKIPRSISIDEILPYLSGELKVMYDNKEYKVIGYLNNGERLVLQDSQKTDCELIVGLNNSVKPLLRKMDSMTNDEKEKYQSLLDDVKYGTKGPWDVTEWLNSKLFDYKDLIGEGMAEEL